MLGFVGFFYQTTNQPHNQLPIFFPIVKPPGFRPWPPLCHCIPCIPLWWATPSPYFPLNIHMETNYLIFCNVEVSTRPIHSGSIIKNTTLWYVDPCNWYCNLLNSLEMVDWCWSSSWRENLKPMAFMSMTNIKKIDPHQKLKIKL